MDRTNSNYPHRYCEDSPVRSVCCRQQCNDSDPYGLLRALQNNHNLQDPQYLNKIIVPMLLVQLLQNQQTCQCCCGVNRQASHSRQYEPPRLARPHDYQRRNFDDYERGHPGSQHYYGHDGLVNPLVQEVSCAPPSNSRSDECVEEQFPPSIQCSEEQMKYHRGDSRSTIRDPQRRQNLTSPRSYDSYGRPPETRPLSPDREIVERCYWCCHRLYRYFDPDQNKRVFTHLPTHRGAILAPAGKSAYGSVKQVSLVDLSPFCPGKDVMLPCPYLCATNETTYSRSYRHPEIVAREALLPKRVLPGELGPSEPYRQTSTDSIGFRDTPQVRPREEMVMFLKPDYCMSRRRNSSQGSGAYCLPHLNPKRDTSMGRVAPRPEPIDCRPPMKNESRRCVTFSPSTDRRPRRRSRSSLDSNSSTSRHSHRSRGRYRHRSGSHAGHRQSFSDGSHPQHRRHSAPYKSRSRGFKRRRSRAKSDNGMFSYSSAHHGRRRHRRRNPRNSHSDPTLRQMSCDEVTVCCPNPQKSVYKTSYGDPAEHPYYEGPPKPNFRRQRTEMQF